MAWMENWYVRCGDNVALLARLRSEHAKVELELPSAFACVSADESSEDATAEMSQRYGVEVILLTYSSTTDSFGFTRCVDGRCVRHLSYGQGEEGMWEVAEGEPEPWERDAFFEEAQLQDIDQDSPHRDAAREMFRQGHVRAGSSWPIVDAREAARAVAVHYRLTGWLEDWLEPVSPRREFTTPSGALLSIPRRGAGDESVGPLTAPPAADSTASAPKRPWWRFW